MANDISENETQQVLRTIEMFEAITESQPDDYQSLEILKEAYNKLGRQTDSLCVSKKLATAYVHLGQISQAILEYEGILQECPEDAVTQTALLELEAMAKLDKATLSLVEDSKPTTPAGVPAGASAIVEPPMPFADSDQALANVLIGERVVTPQAVQPMLEKLKTARRAFRDSGDKTQSLTLLQMVVNEQIAKMDDLLAVMAIKSGLPYMPLSCYDVDRDIAFLLPQEFCLNNCVICFDCISQCALVATANPFSQTTRQEVEATLQRAVFWYIAPPTDIITTLRRVHGMEASER